MSVLTSLYRTTLGKKVVMAVTGLIMVIFVIGHMSGNLKVFAGLDPVSGRYKMDLYGEFLRDVGSELFGHGGFLWVARAVLLLCVVLHAWSGIQLARLNRLARPVNYQGIKYRSANAASRTMYFGGLFLLFFIIFHILHFTTGTIRTGAFAEGAVYSNVYSGFQSAPTALFYVLAMAALGLHLYHGVWSMFQTLGVTSPRWNGGIRAAAKVVALALFLGFSAVPVAAFSGMLAPPAQQHGAPAAR